MKKRFLEIYIPLSIVFGPFLELFFGISLIAGIGISIILTYLVHRVIIYYKHTKASKHEEKPLNEKDAMW